MNNFEDTSDVWRGRKRRSLAALAAGGLLLAGCGAAEDLPDDQRPSLAVTQGVIPERDIATTDHGATIPPESPESLKSPEFPDPVGEPRSIKIEYTDSRTGKRETMYSDLEIKKSYDVQNGLSILEPASGKVAVNGVDGWPMPGQRSNVRASLVGHVSYGAEKQPLRHLRNVGPGSIITIPYDGMETRYLVKGEPTIINKMQTNKLAEAKNVDNQPLWIYDMSYKTKDQGINVVICDDQSPLIDDHFLYYRDNIVVSADRIK